PTPHVVTARVGCCVLHPFPTRRSSDLGSATASTTAAAPASAKANPAVVAYNEGAALANDGKLPEAIAKIEEAVAAKPDLTAGYRSEEHTSELQSRSDIVCRLLLEKRNL